MNVVQILAELANKDIRLWVEDGKLGFSAPEGAMNAEVKNLIVANKPAIIEFLEASAKQVTTSAIPAADRTQPLPLSYSQQRFWFLYQLEPQSTAYTLSGALRLTGTLNLSALSQAFKSVINRHEILRTRYEDLDGITFQHIEPAPDYQITIESPQGKTIEQLANEEAERCFVLEQELPIRTRLIEMASNEYVLLLSLHHIATDGWSMGVLVKEIAVLYGQLSQGVTLETASAILPALNIQYADFAQWQRQSFDGERLEEQLGYWQQQLDNTQALDLQTDYPRPPIAGSAGASLHFSLDSQLSEQLNKLSKTNNVTLFMTLMAAYKTLLHRLSGQTDLCVGSPVANRSQSVLEGLIGCFINTLAIRTDLSGNPSFSELLKREQQSAQGAFNNQDTPFEHIVDHLGLEREMAISPVFQTLLVLQNLPADQSIHLPNLQFEPLEFEQGNAMFDLKITFNEQDDGIKGELEYRTDLYTRQTIENFVVHLQVLLNAVVNNPDSKLSELAILTDEEKTLLVKDNNATEAAIPDICLQTSIEEQASKTPSAAAVIWADNSLSYQALNEQANQFAHYLRSQNIGPGDFVGVCLAGSGDALVSILAIIKAGAAYVPMDISYPADRLQHMASNAQMKLVVSTTAFQALFETLENCRVINLDNDLTLWADNSEENPSLVNTVDDPLYAVYTSGSTGLPKGAAVRHRNEMNLLAWYIDQYAMTQDDRSLIISALGFDLTQKNLFALLTVGGTVVFPHSEHYDPDHIQQLIHQHQISLINCAPSAFYPLVDEPSQWQPLQSLRCVLFGGEPIQFGALKDWLVASNCQLVNMYGPTECTDIAASFELKANTPEGKALINASGLPIGKPNHNVQLFVLDPEFQQLVPKGMPGELCIGGAGVGLGYIHDAGKTAQAFIENPYGEGLIYRTGDLVRYLDDNNLEFLSRIDGQVKIRGFRIELGEIEAQINTLDSIIEAVVADKKAPNGQTVLVAYLIKNQNSDDISNQQIRAHLKSLLPDYMVPSAYLEIDAIPLTPNGKIDRKGLAAPTETQLRNKVFVAPQSDTEITIAEIWSDILGLSKVGTQDDFFELGGHSLLATQLVSKLRTEFNVDLPLRQLFEEPTIAGISRLVLSSEGTATDNTIHKADLIEANDFASEGYPLSFAQQRMWLIDRLSPNNAMYNMPMAIELKGELDIAKLSRAFELTIQKHETLRTQFQLGQDNEPRQIILEHSDFSLEQQALADLAAAKTEAIDFLSKPFDLSSGSLLRAQLLTLNQDHYILLACMHHIISDGWSLQVLLAELLQAYQHQDCATELEIQYKDFAVWQKQDLSGDKLETQLQYWRSQLADLETLNLPFDRPRAATQHTQGRQIKFSLNSKLSAGIKALSQRYGTTDYMTLLAAFQLLMSRISRQNDIAIGSPIAGRQHQQTQALIGFFVNTLVLRSHIDTQASFADLLAQLKQTTLDAYQYQDVPFEQLVDELKVPRDLSHTPLFQVLFVMQNTVAMTDGDAGIDGLAIEQLDLSGDASAGAVQAKFDLSMAIADEGDTFSGEIEFRTALFDSSTIENLLKQFSHLITQLIDQAEQPLTQISNLESSSIQALQQFNAHPELNNNPPFKQFLLHQQFELASSQFAEHTALTLDQQTLTYAELNQQANRIAHGLIKQGVKPGDFVGLHIDRSIELIAALLGILKAGAAYVPLDPHHPADRLSYILEDSNASSLVTTAELQDNLDYQGPIICVDETDNLTDCLATNPDINLTFDSPAYIIYTSGTTGKPKGCVLSHGNVSRLFSCTEEQFGFDDSDVWTLFHSYAFDFTVWELWGALLYGGRLVIIPYWTARDPQQTYQILRDENVTVLNQTPSAFSQLIAVDAEQQANDLQLRHVIFGGEALDFNALKTWTSRHGADRPALINMYGITETTVHVTYHKISAADIDRGHSIIGKPIPDLNIFISDQYGQLTPPGIAGEMMVSGPGVSTEAYLHRPELSAEKFINNNFIDHLDPSVRQDNQRLYRSGDLARYKPDGNIEYLGRIDLQVKIRGHRIELGEIENQITHLEQVREAVVIIADNPSGDGDPIIAAYLLAAQTNTDFDIKLLRQQLSVNLPDYMLPSAFIVMDAWPLTGNGKVDKKALPAIDASHFKSQEYIAPNTDTERSLAVIWADVLKLDRVGIEDNFFEIGGQSLLATKALAQMQTEFQVEIELRKLFEDPSIVAIATLIDLALEQKSLADNLLNDDEFDEDDDEEFVL